MARGKLQYLCTHVPWHDNDLYEIHMNRTSKHMIAVQCTWTAPYQIIYRPVIFNLLIKQKYAATRRNLLSNYSVKIKHSNIKNYKTLTAYFKILDRVVGAGANDTILNTSSIPNKKLGITCEKVNALRTAGNGTVRYKYMSQTNKFIKYPGRSLLKA